MFRLAHLDFLPRNRHRSKTSVLFLLFVCCNQQSDFRPETRQGVCAKFWLVLSLSKYLIQEDFCLFLYKENYKFSYHLPIGCRCKFECLGSYFSTFKY